MLIRIINNKNFKVHNDPVTCLVVNENQFISGTTSNRIGIHSNIDKHNQVTYLLTYFKYLNSLNLKF